MRKINLKRIKDKIYSNSKVEKIIEGKKYYQNNNLILRQSLIKNPDPLRSADNRIPHNFHEILVDEKASYLFTYPIQIDIDNNTKTNEAIQNILGDDFSRKMKNQCIEASNCGTSWVHYWIDKDNNFKYALVPTEEIIPFYSNGLYTELEGIIRYYSTLEYDEKEEKDIAYRYFEYWTNENLTTWKIDANKEILEANCEVGYPQIITHTLGEVPFVEFANNLKKQSDLDKYKSLIDLMDRVMSGFANDLDDIQEIIYILENYGGENLQEFKNDLKKYKAIKTENDGTGGSGGVKTLQIDIPVEARKLILEILKKQIYESGQGLQQDVESVGNASGVALKFFYRKLELKSGLLETEFRFSINKLVKAILKHLNIPHKKITQTWTRNMISNDLETCQIAKESVGVIPIELILRYHPWVDDVEEAKRLKKEEEEVMFNDDYNELGVNNAATE